MEKSATTDAPGPSQAGELVDYIPPRSNIKAASEPEKLGTKSALGRDRQK